jgi:MerR family transcriptional regulator/heat shock protein HspR
VGVLVGLGRLDDEDYPAVTMGQAAELLEVQPAFLRSLDAAGVLTPERSGGGHRRYSRRQLETAARMRALFDQGLTLDAASRIMELQDLLDAARARIAELERSQPAAGQTLPPPDAGADIASSDDIDSADGPSESSEEATEPARRERGTI